MCQYSAIDGAASDWHLMHLGQFAVSGVGMVAIEATHVEQRGRITHGCLGLYSDATEAALARVVAFCRQHGFAWSLRGRCYKLGDDLPHAGGVIPPWIIAGRFLDPEVVVPHLFEAIDPGFHERARPDFELAYRRKSAGASDKEHRP